MTLYTITSTDRKYIDGTPVGQVLAQKYVKWMRKGEKLTIECIGD